MKKQIKFLIQLVYDINLKSEVKWHLQNVKIMQFKKLRQLIKDFYLFNKDKFFEVEIKAFLIHGLKFQLEKKQKVVVDFSSSNIAKQMINYFRRIIIQNIRILRIRSKEYQDYQTNRPVLIELEHLYQPVKQKFDSNEEFNVNYNCKHQFQYALIQEQNKIYQRLNVKVTEYGESNYNPNLSEIVKEVRNTGYFKYTLSKLIFDKLVFVGTNQ